MITRVATDKDFGEIYSLYMEPSSNPYLTYDPMTVDDFAFIYKDLLQSKTLFVTELNNEVIATYRLIPKLYRQTHVCYLGSFVVKKELHGKGIGALVLSEILEYAKAHNKSRIELTVDLHNEPAIHLYKKAGFEIEGIVRNSYKLKSTGKFYDEYLMACILPEPEQHLNK